MIRVVYETTDRQQAPYIETFLETVVLDTPIFAQIVKEDLINLQRIVDPTEGSAAASGTLMSNF